MTNYLLGQYHDNHCAVWSHMLVLGRIIECVYAWPVMGAQVPVLMPYHFILFIVPVIAFF